MRTPSTLLGRRVGSAVAVIVMAAGLLTGFPALPAAAQTDPTPTLLCDEPGEVTARMYRVYFGRVPDAAGLEYWTDVYLRSQSYRTVAWNMAQSAEYRARWDGIDDRTFISELLYRNLLERDPDQAGLDYWLGRLETTPRDQQAIYWVIQPEMKTKHPVVEPADCALLDQLVSLPGGKALEVDFASVEIGTSSHRCAVASINANWVHRDGAEPFSEHVGFAVVDGEIVPSRGPSPGVDVNANTVHGDDNSRGILGLRRNADGGTQDEFSHTFDPSVGALNILSHGPGRGDRTLQLHANYWDDSPGHQFYDPYKFDGKYHGWDWAVGGITMVVDGQQNVVMSGQSYTFETTRHSFAAFDSSGGTFIFGSTTAMTAQQLVDWLRARGYHDIMKMDGGGSVEFNESGRSTVAGTTRPLPVWLGVGC